ncbi:hypothetical protein CBR_g39543 [Chara braunii]|uniref:GB1/RHD3-type G domain-containing protein n=1 Tax=Chara braunii TaxID=69332 RepID=A0A388LRW0_CHABU|nr:hypothetical protein CBR_g39543 [Chara braunii]|eukprot:GBG85078.1 hypothetical protein CBR_g39543 [Chara braunii]
MFTRDYCVFSLIMSRLVEQLLGRSSGFEVGPTHRPCTKGLWMWSAPIKVTSPTGEPYHMILLDTEGIDATDQTGTYSTQIFSLGVLLSSTFVYNQMGPIDEAALDKLSLITEMVKNIKMKSSSQSKSSSAAELSQFAPFFLWLLRDFYLELQEDGREISPKDYLELSLRPAAGSDRAVVSKNEVRDLIRSLFPDRDCFALVRPVTDERDLHRLSSIPMNKLRPEFLTGLKTLTDLIYSKTRPKQMDGMMLTGPALAGMAQCFITAINGGAVPVISTSWEHVAESECRRATEKATEAYWDALDRTVAPEEDLLNAAHKKAAEVALAVFGEEAVGGGTIRLKFEHGLVNSLAKLFEDYKANLYKDSEIRCSNILDTLRKELSERCRDPSTTIQDFFEILDELLVRYEHEMCGPGKWRHLVKFMYQSARQGDEDGCHHSQDKEIKELQGRGKKSAKETSQLAEKLKEKDISLAVLDQELKTVKAELKRVNEAADQAHSRAANAEREVRDARMAEAAAVKERDRAVGQAEVAAKAQKAAEEQVKHMTQLEKDSRAMAISANKQKEEIRVVEARLKAELAEAQRLLEANRSSFAEREAELQENITKQQSAVKALEDKLARERGGKSDAMRSVEAREAELSQLRQGYDSLRQSHEGLRQKLDKQKEIENELEKKVQELQRQVLSESSQIAATAKERDTVKSTLEQTTLRLDEARKRAEKAESLLKEKEKLLCDEEQGKLKAISEVQELLAMEQHERVNAEKREVSVREELQRLQEKMVLAKGDLERIKKEKDSIEAMVQDMERARGVHVQEADSKHAEAVKQASTWRDKFEKLKENSDMELKKVRRLLAQTEEEKRNANERLEDAMLHANRQIEEASRMAFEKTREVEAIKAELHTLKEELAGAKQKEMTRAEDLARQLSMREREMQRLEQQLLDARRREEELDGQLKAYTVGESVGAPGRLKRRRVAEAMDVDETVIEVEQVAQQNGDDLFSIRKRDSTADMAEGSSGRELVEATPQPEHGVVVASQQAKDYEKWTMTKLKQEITRNDFGHELLKLGRPTKKDLLALYERCVVRPKEEESG